MVSQNRTFRAPKTDTDDSDRLEYRAQRCTGEWSLLLADLVSAGARLMVAFVAEIPRYSITDTDSGPVVVRQLHLSVMGAQTIAVGYVYSQRRSQCCR